MKKLAITTIIILATITVCVLLWQFREAVILFLLSLGIAAATRPAVDRLLEKGIQRSVAILIVYFMTILAIVLLLVLVSGALINELQKVSNTFTTTYEQIFTRWPQGNQFQKTIATQLPPPQTLYSAITGNQGETIVQALLGFTLSSFTVISQFFAILILSIYWSIDRVHFERLWLSILPVETRARAREIWRDIDLGVGSYIRSELLQSFLTGILLGVGFSLIGINYPILLAIWGALAWLIPWLGALFAVIPVIAVALTLNPVIGLLAVAFTLLVLISMETVIEPRIFNRKKYSSLLIVFFMIAMADLLGLVGIIIAPPMAAAMQIFLSHITTPSVQSERTEPVQQILDLGERVFQVHSMIEVLEVPPSPKSVNMLGRLDKLIEKAHEISTEKT